MPKPYNPHICCSECRCIAKRSDDVVRMIAPSEPVWVDAHQRHEIFCREHVPERFFDLRGLGTDQPCETCGESARPLMFHLSWMLQTASGRVFCSVAHVPPDELKEHTDVRVGPCETCGRETHVLGGLWKLGKPPRLFCSWRCHDRFYLLQNQAKRVKANLRQCTVCGRTFEPRQSNPVTCSSACRQKTYWQRKRTIAAGQPPTQLKTVAIKLKRRHPYESQRAVRAGREDFEPRNTIVTRHGNADCVSAGSARPPMMRAAVLIADPLGAAIAR